MHLHTYLNFGGNCEQAFRFYEQHLGGRVTLLMRHADGPEAQRFGPEWDDKVLHARLDLGGTFISGADVPAERFQPMRSAYLTLECDSSSEAERVYALLSEEGQVFMPMAETFFAHRFGMCRDRFGTSWMVQHPKPA
jgi:PhnB protein